MTFDIEKAISTLHNELQSWFEAAVASLPNLISAIIVFVLFYFLARIVRQGVIKLMMRVSNNRAVDRLLSNVAYMATIAAGLFVSLGILELEKTVTSLLAGAGVIGLALGLAFQEFTSNLIAGVVIAFRKPIALDEIVDIVGHMGSVKSVSLRATEILTFSGQIVTIPNKTLLNEPLINFSRAGKRRVDVEVGVSYGDDLDLVEKTVMQALEEIDVRDKTKDVEFWLQAFGSSSINGVARVWVNYPGQLDYLKATHQMIKAIKQAFADQDIMIPFPIRTLDFGIKGGKPLGETALQIQRPTN